MSTTLEEAAAVRQAAIESVQDIGPGPLHDRVMDLVASGSLAPGIMTLRCAGAVNEKRHRADGGVAVDSGGRYLENIRNDTVTERAAAVQIFHDSMLLRRSWSRDREEVPWKTGDAERANIDMLVGQVMSTRAFYLLAPTDAAEIASDVLRAYSRDERFRQKVEDRDREVADEHRKHFKRDVFELAAVTGATAYDTLPSEEFRDYVIDMAHVVDEDTETLPEEAELDRLASHVSPDPPSIGIDEYEPRALAEDRRPLPPS